MSDNNDKRTATQRIEDLERVVTVLYQSATETKNAILSFMNTQKDMVLVKDTLKLLHKKIEAVIQSADPSTGIEAGKVSDMVVSMNVTELTAQVAQYVANGLLILSDEVAEGSYLVCEEADASGTVTNPRIQFPLTAQDAETQELFRGKKVGDVVSFGEGKLDAKILELYTVAPPQAAPAPEATAEAPSEAAPEASAEAAPEASAPAEAASA